MLTIFENKHDTGLAFVIWLFVVLKVVGKNYYIILGDMVYSWLLLIQVKLNVQNHKIPPNFILVYIFVYYLLHPFIFLKAPGLQKNIHENKQLRLSTRENSHLSYFVV